MYTEILQKLESSRQRLTAISDTVRLTEGEMRLKELEEAMSRPGFWDNRDSAQAVVEETRKIRGEVEPVKRLLGNIQDLEELTELANADADEASLGEIVADIDGLLAEVDRLELTTTLGGEHDAAGAFLSIHAGAGGTEACDWVAMLLRLYSRWAEDNGYKSKLVDSLDGEEAGLRSATLQIDGEYAYGYLKCEIGVHRLVRISPFDAKNRRHTSFASVDVTPVVPESAAIAINASELRIDTFCAGGAGGQHVNRTESAVRITHLPSGVVVQCQNERSQHSNKAQAMRILKSRLIQLEASKREKELSQMYSEKGEIAWGNQIRSYVLQPYTLVKDHRTGHEMGDAQKVLDGGLMTFIEAYLRWKRKERE